jgi:hypothetical protein
VLAVAALGIGAATVTPVEVWAHPSSVADNDHDGVLNHEDVCPDAFDSDQRDTDADGEPPRLPTAASTTGGDACDTDDDGDKVDDALDNCRLVENPAQNDLDGDGEGDICDGDDDADGVMDTRDNCVKVSNADQADRDDDFIGDVCDPEPGAPAPGSGPSPGSGPAPAAPTMAVRLRRSHRLAEIRGGLAVPVRVSAAALLVAELSVDASTARRLRLSRALVAQGTNDVGEAGRTFVFARFSKSALRALARSQRRVRLTLRLTARDASGRSAAATRTLWVSP